MNLNDDESTTESLNGDNLRKTDEIGIDQIESSEERKKRLRKTFGNCYKLSEILSNQGLKLSPYISPLLTEEPVLDKMPKTYLIVG